MLSLRRIGPEDVQDVRDIRVRAAEDLTIRHGVGHWSHVTTLRTLRRRALEKQVLAVDRNGSLIGTFTVSAKKIGFYRNSWFANPDDPALYLTDMAIHPNKQRMGVGRWCMAEIDNMARRDGLLAVRLDAYDAPAGAGAFYEKCGYRRVHHGSVNGTPLMYYEKTFVP